MWPQFECDEARRRAQLEFGDLNASKRKSATPGGKPTSTIFSAISATPSAVSADHSFSVTAIFALALASVLAQLSSRRLQCTVHALPYKHFGRSVVVKLHNLANGGGLKTASTSLQKSCALFFFFFFFLSANGKWGNQCV